MDNKEAIQFIKSNSSQLCQLTTGDTHQYTMRLKDGRPFLLVEYRHGGFDMFFAPQHNDIDKMIEEFNNISKL